MLSKKNCEIINLLLLFFLVIQILTIFLVNVFLSKDNIDCDSAKLFVHAIEIVKERSLLLHNWSYPSTLELDSSLLLAVPLFLITGNIYLSFSISNIIFLLLLIWCIFKIFKGMPLAYPLLASIFVCIPYRVGQLDYTNMMFFNGSQYIIKTTLPLMFLAILITKDSFKELSRANLIKEIAFWVIYYSLLFVAGLSSGVYVFVCGLLPVIIGVMFWNVYNKKELGSVFLIKVGFTVLFSVIGILLNYMLKVSVKGNEMTLCHIYGELQDNISACLIGIFEVFGGASYENTIIMTYTGINILIRMLFVLLLFVCAVFVLFRTLKKKTEVIPTCFLVIFIWNTFILCISKTTYGAPTFEYRYHLIGIIPLICLFVCTILEWYKSYADHTKYRVGGKILIAVIILTLSFTSYKHVINTQIDNSDLQEICEYAKELNVDYAYFLYESSAPEICRLLDHEEVIYLQGMSDQLSRAIDYYEKYSYGPMQLDNALIICDNNIYDYGDIMEMYGRTYRRCNIIGTRSIYR